MDCDFKISDIGNLLQLLERTIYRRMAHFGLQKRVFSDIDDDNLDNILSGIVVDFPRCGESMLLEILKGKGIKVQRWRLRDAIHRIDYASTQERKTGRLHRRVYNVMAPNHLWHTDSNHKLRLDIWTQTRASHRVRTTNSSPVNVWIAGQIQNPVGTQLSERYVVDYELEGNIDAANLMDDGRPIFEPMNNAINDQLMRADFNRTGTNFGIDDFVNCGEILSAQA
ncbi:unnamed protein product [Mytilus coruscus]|uniref:Uncharacterized protein n=1 Tax=Mytilus coruscus TaxID=42192 RepID=A0A6J8B340_MYTCO|nr:unnamed protein product [Mytilus coruscus]